jgi:hypothetical protein
MRNRFHVLVLLSAVLVLGVSFAMLGWVIGFASPWLALLLMFNFLGIAKFAEPLFMLRMPKALYALRRWETEGDALRRLGVFGFAKFLRRTPLRHLNSRVYLDRQHRDPLKVRRQAESGEATHFWGAVLFTPYIALTAVTGHWGIAITFSLAQVLVNIYPILHLRHIRGRLDRTILRMNPNP